MFVKKFKYKVVNTWLEFILTNNKKIKSKICFYQFGLASQSRSYLRSKELILQANWKCMVHYDHAMAHRNFDC